MILSDKKDTKLYLQHDYFYRFNERKKEEREQRHRTGVKEKGGEKVKTLEKYIKAFLKLYKL